MREVRTVKEVTILWTSILSGWVGKGGGGLITLLVTQQTSITSEQSGLFNRPSIKYEEWNINYCGILV